MGRQNRYKSCGATENHVAKKLGEKVARSRHVWAHRPTARDFCDVRELYWGYLHSILLPYEYDCVRGR